MLAAFPAATDGIQLHRPGSPRLPRPAGRSRQPATPRPADREAYGGGGRIRTPEGCASRFTVCPRWPLGYPSKNVSSEFSLIRAHTVKAGPALKMLKARPDAGSWHRPHRLKANLRPSPEGRPGRARKPLTKHSLFWSWRQGEPGPKCHKGISQPGERPATDGRAGLSGAAGTAQPESEPATVARRATGSSPQTPHQTFAILELATGVEPATG